MGQFFNFSQRTTHAAASADRAGIWRLRLSVYAAFVGIAAVLTKPNNKSTHTRRNRKGKVNFNIQKWSFSHLGKGKTNFITIIINIHKWNVNAVGRSLQAHTSSIELLHSDTRLGDTPLSLQGWRQEWLLNQNWVVRAEAENQQLV